MHPLSCNQDNNPFIHFQGGHISVVNFLPFSCYTLYSVMKACKMPPIYSVFQKSDAKIQITITMAHLIRINYPLSNFNYHLSGTNVANFNKIHRKVSEQQLLKKWKNRIFQCGKYRLAYLQQVVL